ncbi:ATP-binding cassette domain-containing protein [Streptomyces sp. NPDC087270]|uniref:ATP-binding cassette domain-containing protein n=1 Tax=Streptomyces sp. NPDC087270 TaxID=3365774 RepID=UPI0037F4A7CC
MTEPVHPEEREKAAVPAVPRLSVGSLSITFGSARVLRDVALDVAPGEIHALIGQNGCGKSTLAKILTGVYNPDHGSRVSVDGADVQLPIRPDEARARGVAVVHQSLGLVRDATVLENTRLGRLTASRFLRRIDWQREREATRAVFRRMGRDIPLDARVADLREDERAVVAIARALQDLPDDGGLIILDESTRALGREALEHFFELLDGIVANGTSVLLITHRLEEVIDAADRVTVMRDGQVVVAGRPVEGMDKTALASLMLGRQADDLEHRSAAVAIDGPPVVVAGLTGLRVHDVGFGIKPGEVLGLTGLGGSGYDDVPYLLSGATRAEAGTVTLPSGTAKVRRLSPTRAVAAGVALVPEGREDAGLAMEMTVTENLAFPQTCTGKRLLAPVDTAFERQLARDWIERLDVRPRLSQTLLKNMSGGNQQKVLLAKWLATDPALLVLHEPTQAVDVGARHIIVSAVREAARQGRSVLVAGSDENELALLCDRVLVFADGAVREEITGDITPERIVGSLYTSGPRARLRQRAGAGG